MKITNFRSVEVSGKNALDKIFTATVDVTTGFLLWKKTEARKIQRKYGGCWYFVDTGKFTPIGVVGNLARAYTAQTGEET